MVISSIITVAINYQMNIFIPNLMNHLNKLKPTAKAFVKAQLRSIVFFALGICLIVITITIVYLSFQQMETINKDRRHFTLIIKEANRLTFLIQSSETNMSGYVLTNNQDFLKDYLKSNQINTQLEIVQRLMSHKIGNEFSASLTLLVQKKIDFMQEAINLARNGQNYGALELIKSGKGFYLTQLYYAEMQRFITLHETMLSQNEKKFSAKLHNFFNIAMVSSILAAIFAFIAADLLYRESRQKIKNLVSEKTKHLLQVQEKINAQLEQSNFSLESHKEQLNVTLNSIGDGVIATDIFGRVTRLNSVAEVLTGWSSEEAINKQFDDIFHIVNALTGEPVPSPIFNTLAQDKMLTLPKDTVLISRDSKRYTISDTCAPIFSLESTVQGAVIVFKDISEQESIRKRLRINELVFRATFENACVGIAHVSPNGQIIKVNDWFCKIIGYTPAEVLMHTFQDITHPDDLAADLVLYKKVLSGEIDDYQIEKRYIHKSKTTVWVDLSTSCIRNVAGDVDYFIGIVVDVTERKQAQAESMRFFSLSQELLCIANFKGDFIAVNAMWEKTFGYTINELVSKSYLDFVHVDDREITKKALTKIQVEGGLFGFENRYVDKNNEVRHLLWTVTMDSATKLLYCSARDITERKIYEKNLLLRNNQFQTLLDSAPVGIFVLNSQLVITHHNLLATKAYEKMEQIHGEGLSVMLAGLMPRDQAEAAISQFKHTLETGESYHVSNYSNDYAPSGVIKFWDWQFNRIALTDSEFGVVCFFREVTERVLNQEKILENERRFRTLFDRGPVAMYFCDTEGRIVEYNDYAVKIWQAEPLPNQLDEEFRRHLKFYLPSGVGVAFTQTFLMKVLNADLPSVVDQEVIFERPDGSRVTVVINIVPIKDTLGNIAGAMTSFYDMTERVKAEEALLSYTYELKDAKAAAEKANAAKSEFLSSMSHELRTPLNAILGFAQLMESAKPTLTITPTPNQLNSIQQILHGGWYLLDLINEVLELSQIESGKHQFALTPVLLNEVLAECGLLIEPLAARYGVNVTFAPLEAETYVLSDKTKLKQIVINILSNAIKYNKENGVVEIDFNLKKDLVKINVRDTGHGLSQDQLDHLFEPFNRLGKDSTSEEGTGIGLVVSKKLIEYMQGSIGVRSRINHGSVFWITLKIIKTPVFFNSQPSITKTKRARTQVKKDIAEANKAIKSVSDIAQINVINDALGLVNNAPANSEAEDLLIEPLSIEQMAEHSTSTENNFKLLYIEDSKANLSLVEVVAMRNAIVFRGAENGELGLTLATEWLPHVILLDINLSGMNGFEVLKVLKTSPITAFIPVIAISANAMPADIARGLEAGFFKYITKPIKLNELLETLNIAFEHSKNNPN